MVADGSSPCNDVSASLSGTGKEIVCLSFSPSSHDFGDVDIGESSEPAVFTLRNNMDITITGTIYIDGSDSSQFTVIDGNGAFSLEPDTTMTITISFNPTFEGDISATLVADPDEASCEKATADLHGRGTLSDDLDITPNSKNFGTISVNHCSEPFKFTLINHGEDTISGNIFLDGSDSAQFIITEGDGYFTLPTGGSKTIKVQFCPDSKGTKTATLKVDADYPYKDETASLSGVGELPDILILQPTSHNFPDTTVSKTSDPFSFTLTNNDPETTAKVNIYEESNDFVIIEGGGVVDIPPDSTHVIKVKFCPQTEGQKEASLKIDGINCQSKSASLTGYGKPKSRNIIHSFIHYLIERFPFLHLILSKVFNKATLIYIV